MSVTVIYEDEFSKEEREDRFITYFSIILLVTGFAKSMALDQKLYFLNHA